MRTIDNENKISRGELMQMSENMFGELVKAVADIEKEIMVVDDENIQKKIRNVVNNLVLK